MQVPEEFITMAKTYQVLSGLEPQQLRKLLPIAQDRSFASGEILFREGDKSSFFHLIVSGTVALEETAGKQPVVVQTLNPGDAVGWSALTEGSLTHFQARALSPLKTVAFPGEKIRTACDLDPAMGYSFLKQLLAVVTERLDAARMQLAGKNGNAAPSH